MRTVHDLRRGLALAAIAAIAAASVPVGAAAPLALLAKEIVTGIARGLVEDALHASLMAALGPCDGALASSALGAAQGLASVRGGSLPALPPGLGAIPGGVPAMPGGMPQVPGIPSMPGVPSMPGGAGGPLGLPGAAAAGAGGLSQLFGGGGSGATGPLSGFVPRSGRLEDLPAPMRQAIEQEHREYRESQRARGLTQAQIDEEDRETIEEAAEMEQTVRAMFQDPKPLTASEIDEFVDLYGRFASMAPGGPTCSPASLKRLLTLTPAASLPMVGGQMRTMLRVFRQMDEQFAEARKAYAEMGPGDRAEHLDLLAAEMRGWPPEQRNALLGAARSGQLGMPTAMVEELERRVR